MDFIKKYAPYLYAPALAALVIFGVVTGIGRAADAPLKSCMQKAELEWSRDGRAAWAAQNGIWGWTDSRDQKAMLYDAMCGEESLGFTVVTDYQKNLSAPMTAVQSFIPVTSLTLKDGTVVSTTAFGDKVFLTLEPGAAKEEIVMCTGVDTSALQFTGCTRGLAFSGTNTAGVAANQKTHSSGVAVVISNVHYVYQQFVDITGGDQSVTGTKTFNANTLPFGDNTTGTGKQIIFRVGQASGNPYFKVVGPSGSNTTSTFLFSVDGTSELQLNSNGTVLTVDPTKGLTLSGGVLSINASSTAGMAFDSDGKLYVSVSSTGGLAFDSLGRLKIDGGQGFTFSGNVSFTGDVTYTGSTANPTNIATTQYVNVAVNNFAATGTAGVTLAAGEALRVGGDGRFYLTSAAATNTVYEFVGVAITSAASAGDVVTYIKPGGVVSSTAITGLLPDRPVFLADTAGDVSVTKGTIANRIGRAISPNSFLVLSPLVSNRASGVLLPAWAGETTFVNTVWTPTKIRFQCGLLTSGSSAGEWMDAGGASGTQSSTGWDDSNANTIINIGRICAWEEGGTYFEAVVATSTGGFKFTTNNVGANRTVVYFAEMNDDYDAH